MENMRGEHIKSLAKMKDLLIIGVSFVVFRSIFKHWDAIKQFISDIF